MEKYENSNALPSPEYGMYTAEYLRALFTLLDPSQSYRYPATNLSSPYIPTYKTQARQSEASLEARRCFLNFNQVYAQNFSPFMIEVLRNLPRHRRLGRTCHNSHKKRLNSKTPDYLELNRRRPSVIRRSLKSGTKCSSPREAVLEPSFENDHEMNTEQEITPVTPNFPQLYGNFIHKHPQLSTKDSRIMSPNVPNYPQPDAYVIPKGPHLSTNDPQIIHKVPQREHRRSPIIQNATPFIPKESQPDHVILPITPKRPFVSSILHSTEHQKPSVIQKKHRTSSQSTETSCDPTPVNDKPDLDKATPDHVNLIETENPQQRNSLSVDSTTNPIEQSRTSVKNSNTAKPDVPSLGQNENIQPSKKERKYKYCCFHCKKRFRWFSHWQAHERIHTGVRPYKCNQCDSSFTRGDGLQAHMMIHSTKKPHQCSICSKLFARKSMLEKHILEHTGIIPYKCDVCQHELLDPETIEVHLAQHEEQKRFTCQYCHRCFINGRRLVRHIRAHTGKISLMIVNEGLVIQNTISLTLG